MPGPSSAGLVVESSGRVGRRRLVQTADLTDAQLPPLPRREVVVADGTDARPDQSSNLEPHGLAHPPDLAVTALVDHDLERDAVVAPGQDPDPGRSGDAVVELDALSQPPKVAAAGTPSTSARYTLSIP